MSLYWRRFAAVARASGLIIPVTLVVATARAASPGSQALGAALASREEPRLVWQGDTGLTMELANKNAGVVVSGVCIPPRPVVVTGQGIAEPVQADCNNAGRYSAVIAQHKQANDEIIATQVMLDGTIFVARSAGTRRSDGSSPIAAQDLAAALGRAKAGDHIIVAPQTYSDLKISVAGRGGTPDDPIVIDGQGRVTFTGATRIAISAPNVTLRGMKFAGTGVDTIMVSGEGVRLAELVFTGCGDPRKTKGECILIGNGGKRTEVDFSTFAKSTSMSMKVRAGADDAPDQPTDVSIHHNVFRDIDRLSGNGQEPIQIAGPNGGGSNIALRTRVEHNLFYRAQGDVEAISLKTPGLVLRWNVFRDMDAAPNVRGSHGDIVTGNILLRTRPFRVAGRGHRIADNTILCPSQGVGLILSHGSPGYEAATDNVIENNIVATSRVGVVIGAQTQPMEEPARGNRFSGNRFFLPAKRPVYEVRPPEDAEKIEASNTMPSMNPGPALCQ
jgi:hypothetical protein